VDEWTRRKFLIASGVAGGGALATGAGAIGLAELLRTAGRDDVDRSGLKLVIVTLYGGNDGLNTVVPYADPQYHALRPELAYKPEDVLHLNRHLGLNRGLSGLKRLWDKGRLAIVLGTGYPRPDRSHFRSMDIWQTASPTNPVGTGWMGRWLDAVKAEPELAISFEPVLPPLLAGATRVGVCVTPGGLNLPDGLHESIVATLGRDVQGEPAMMGRAATAFRDLLRVNHIVGKVQTAGHAPADASGAPAPATVTGGEQTLADQLGLIARCVEAGVPTRVYSASLGGFDTHAGERAAQERLLKQLDAALTGFADRLSRTKAGRQVVTLVYSEFGRRVHANASDGTDHGTAGPVFVLGAPVTGGFYGEQPSLTDLDDGDLKSTMDFRDVYATLLNTVLGADPEQFLEGYRPKLLPFFASP
jgi:uncharacterized protein (DUF1501 family)